MIDIERRLREAVARITPLTKSDSPTYGHIQLDDEDTVTIILYRHDGSRIRRSFDWLVVGSSVVNPLIAAVDEMYGELSSHRVIEHPPIHSHQGDKAVARIFRKTGLYGSEQICEIYSGRFAKHNPEVDARILGNALCDYLETQRPPEPEGIDDAK